MTAPRVKVLDSAFEVELAAEDNGVGVMVLDGVSYAVVTEPDGQRKVLTHKVPEQRRPS